MDYNATLSKVSLGITSKKHEDFPPLMVGNKRLTKLGHIAVELLDIVFQLWVAMR